MGRDIKIKRKINIRMAILYGTILMLLFLLYDFGLDLIYNQSYSDTSLFTEEELAVLEKFENQTLKFGIRRNQELGLRFAIKEFMHAELGINLEFIAYDTYDELVEAAFKGEVDIFSYLLNDGEREDLYWISTFIPNLQFVITNRHQPLMDVIKLGESHIGFINEGLVYQDFRETIGSDYFESRFFDSLDEALDALDNQEIEAFITKLERGVDELIVREDLQIEFTFQNTVFGVKFATTDGELYEALAIFEEILNSSRAGLFINKLGTLHIESVETSIKNYMVEKYDGTLVEYRRAPLKIGMHHANFSYSFFDKNGVPSGIYLEMMDLLKALTGIDYEIVNCKESSNFDRLFKELMNNEIQFLLGTSEVIRSEMVTKIGKRGIQDNIISIEKLRNNTELKGISELNFGVVISQEVVDLFSGIANIVEFNDYETAINSLINNEIDVLMTRESVLAYYRDVVGIKDLSQTNHINRLSSHGILGNVENDDLNRLMEDILRLYPLVDRGEQGIRWGNQMIQYQQAIPRQRSSQENILRLVIGLVGLLCVIWILKKERETRILKKVNERDPLTGLYNKRTYENKCLELMAQHPDQLGVFFFIDIDDFKRVNDLYGHEVGDKLLLKFANVLKELTSKKANTICFRIAGDEFGVFSIGYQAKSEIYQLMDEMKESLKVHVMGDVKTQVLVRFSAGGSIYNQDTVTFSNLKKYADFAMYQAKKCKDNEINHLELFNFGLLYDYHGEKLMSSFTNLRIEKQHITAVYQPIYSLNGAIGIYGFEGLSRPKHLSVSNISQLIELAEKVGKIIELDLIMMEAVIRGFNKEGKLFINIMGKTPTGILEYLNHMIHLAQEVGICMANIVLELSERTKWSQDSLQIIIEFREKYHFLIAVDDFGIGFSGNAILLDVQPDIVKIDRYFISKIYEDKQKYGFVKSFIEFIKSNNMKVIGEGIEEKQELDVLKALGSDFGQGYYLGKPD